ncbi:hypothetical protein CLF_104254 [Clonorchis sinensis]|uniref:Uncharacterized protein n=1 Tax=Clonorchis sinensis TaxID=79923 RepID=G7YB89_CLOSI|nr:hypothetical protein CLF_104254 [Clonorchis sinensis]
MGDEIVNSEVGLQFLKLRWKAETGEGITSNVKALLIRYQLKIQYRFSELKFRNQACNGRHGERIFDEQKFGNPRAMTLLSENCSRRKIQYRFSELKFRNQACNGRHGERIFDETMFGFVTTKFSGGAFTKGIIELYNFNARTNIHR